LPPSRETNPLYYDILAASGRESGLRVLVNTSFSVYEEPIVNKPAECLKALLDGRIDFVVTIKASTSGPWQIRTYRSARPLAKDWRSSDQDERASEWRVGIDAR
jgi:hypothetical protein